MFLITRLMYEAAYGPALDPEDEPREPELVITPYEREHFAGTLYYFRLGAAEEAGLAVPLEDGLEIPARSMMPVWSLEEFKLSNRVFGILGSFSGLHAARLQLVHGPSVEPGFVGSLELAVVNHGEEPVRLDLGARIGKVVFFDVTDSMVAVDDFVESQLMRERLAAREGAADVILESYRYVKLGRSVKRKDLRTNGGNGSRG